MWPSNVFFKMCVRDILGQLGNYLSSSVTNNSTEDIKTVVPRAVHEDVLMASKMVEPILAGKKNSWLTL